MQNAYASYQSTQLIGRFSWLPAVARPRCRRRGLRSRGVAVVAILLFQSSRPSPSRSRPRSRRAPGRRSSACACPIPQARVAARPPAPRRRTDGSGPPSPRTRRAGSRSRSPGSPWSCTPSCGRRSSGRTSRRATCRLVQQLSSPRPPCRSWSIPAPPGRAARRVGARAPRAPRCLRCTRRRTAPLAARAARLHAVARTLLRVWRAHRRSWRTRIPGIGTGLGIARARDGSVQALRGIGVPFGWSVGRPAVGLRRRIGAIVRRRRVAVHRQRRVGVFTGIARAAFDAERSLIDPPTSWQPATASIAPSAAAGSGRRRRLIASPR